MTPAVIVERLISVVVSSFFYGGKRKANMTLLGSMAPLRSEVTVQWLGFF